jgi:acyl-coenzyme A synthetase/AMP-(fatty) acid ligase/SAM-dependent methyltransferase/uncharacterized protein YbaR (Trm112 family)
MKSSNLQILHCPACRLPYNIRVIERNEDSVETAFLTCPRCCITIPVLRGFPIFEQQFLSAPDLDALSQELFGTEQEHLEFLERKEEKPVYDLYAAFQPFNESTQSIFPLLPLLKQVLKPGDLILDLWCRTGWTGEFLSSVFPEQEVISVWESASGLLGLKGFDFWLGTNKRRNNLDVIFHSPNFALPFADKTFAVIHGLDTLHRYHHVPLISECMRVVTPEGILVYPHNHLTNSEPEPYFDRGEDQIHGKEYQTYFSQLLKNSNRRAFVLSETTLFDAPNKYELTDEANTDHYNACILIADSSYEGKSFICFKKESAAYRDAHIIVNPLYRLDLVQGLAVPAPEAMDSGGETLFFRHPIYLERLQKHSPVNLNEVDRLILYWAMRIKTVSEISAILNLHEDEIFSRLKDLESKEVVQLQNISEAMAKLQNYYSHQEFPHTSNQSTLPALWKKAQLLHHDHPFVIWPADESVFTYKDADTIVRMTASFLTANGITKGDRIVIDAISHPEFMFLFWAGILSGAVMIPINPEMKNDTYTAILERTNPKLVFFDAEKKRPNREQKSFAFGANENSDSYKGSFSEQLSGFEPQEHFAECSEMQEAVILFTSGSTGTPKGVMLSHGALFRTGKIMQSVYRWNRKDCFLSGGYFHTMSGLRNPCIAVLHSGSSVIIPGNENMQNPLSIMNLCLKHQATILNVPPAFLAYWKVAEKKAKFFQPNNLRMILSTGSTLQPVHRENFEKLFGIPVYDYYGLTETTGACILQIPASEARPPLPASAGPSLGKPRGCLIKLINGELAIYSDNLMLGYLNEEAMTRRRIQNGWLMTGDIAEITQDGNVILTGRIDRMMVDRNGENVYPEEIEREICTVSGVTDAYVTQIQDSMKMDQIVALIQFNGDISQVRNALSSKLPVQQIPSIFLKVNEIPKSAAGKASVEECMKLITAETHR